MCFLSEAQWGTLLSCCPCLFLDLKTHDEWGLQFSMFGGFSLVCLQTRWLIGAYSESGEGQSRGMGATRIWGEAKSWYRTHTGAKYWYFYENMQALQTYSLPIWLIRVTTLWLLMVALMKWMRPNLQGKEETHKWEMADSADGEGEMVITDSLRLSD